MEPHIRYVTTRDGVNIAYYAIGEGPPTLLFYSLPFTHLEAEWQVPLIRERFTQAAKDVRLIRLDPRGFGLSSRDVSDFSVDAMVSDIEAVVERLDVQLSGIQTTGYGSVPAIAYAARHPEMHDLILEPPLASGIDGQSARFLAMRPLIEVDWELASETVIRSFNPAWPDQVIKEMGGWLRLAIQADEFLRFVDAADAWNVDQEARAVTARALLIHNRNNPNEDMRITRRVASLIPDSHIAFVNDALEAQQAIREFYSGVPEPSASAVPLPSDATAVITAAAAGSFGNGRYIVDRLLGEGGQKTVFLVHDTTLDRNCALSLLRTDFASAEEAARITREAQTMARLAAHQNIVTVHDLGEHQGRSYIVCEYVPGGDLHALIRDAGGPLPPPRAIDLARDVCRALVIAHDRGVIHRDIKPANIWLNADGSAKLGDFGVASAVGLSRITMVGTVVGTAAYMSPEQAQGHEIDARSDLYALGCVMYELVTGRPPFIGAEPLAVISQHVHAAAPSARRDNSELPAGVEDLITRLLAKNMSDRPESAAAVLAELDRMAAG